LLWVISGKLLVARMTFRRKISIGLIVLAAFLGGIFFVYSQIYFSHGKTQEKKIVAIKKGDNALVVGEKLKKEGIISGKYYLAIYLWKKNNLHSLVAGVYEFVPGLKISEIAQIITGGEVLPTSVPVTFPEGMTIENMATVLDKNGFSGADFISITNNPPQELKDKYKFLSEIPVSKSLEGYLFPDTYFIAKDAKSEQIIDKMLDAFNDKVFLATEKEIKAQNKTLYQIITMASILEKEVNTEEDFKIVSGIFWKRLSIGQALQSDATLEYILKTKDFQHSVQQTQVDSPYNAYKYKGLPPGPISNPGIDAIMAALNPQDSKYLYFLTDPKNPKNTVYSATFEEHVVNKRKFGL
jgi:UPF0755 protein